MPKETHKLNIKKDFPPLTPPEQMNDEEAKRIECRERRSVLEDIKLGAVAGGGVIMPAVGMGVVEMDNNKENKIDPQNGPGPNASIEQKDKSHLDPISGEPGAHPVGVGVGAATGGVAAGAASGLAFGAMAGPVGAAMGAAIGAAVGAVAGGIAGKGIAESMHPTVLDVEEYEMLQAEEDKENIKAAHAFGWNSRLEFLDETWEAAEGHLRAEWESDDAYHSHRSWDQVKKMVKESWDQADSHRNN